MTKRYLFRVTPMGAVRQVRSDTWHPRDCVVRYRAYRDQIRYRAREIRYLLKDTLDIIAYIPMPASWSARKRALMEGKPCLVKPDSDNIAKGFMDAIDTEDSHVWDVRCRKYWGVCGSLEVYESTEDEATEKIL